MDCVFCKIVRGELPSMKIYEDEHSIVFMDIAKDVDGPMVAIPKTHAKSIIDCGEDTISHLLRAVKKVSCHCVDNCGYDGVNLLNASEEAAGQSVAHFHIHIIPRKNGDGIDAWPTFKGAAHETVQMHKALTMIEE